MESGAFDSWEAVVPLASSDASTAPSSASAAAAAEATCSRRDVELPPWLRCNRLAAWLRSACARRMKELKRFFTALSVRPCSIRAISLQRFPRRAWAEIIILSSSGVQGRLQICGESWFNQRSRACLPVRPGMCSAMSDHLRGPIFSTRDRSSSSSSGRHGPLTSFRSLTRRADGVLCTWARFDGVELTSGLERLLSDDTRDKVSGQTRGSSPGDQHRHIATGSGCIREPCAKCALVVVKLSTGVPDGALFIAPILGVSVSETGECLIGMLAHLAS